MLIIATANGVCGRFRVAHNGSRLCAGGALKHESFNPPQNLI
jgi:hypothetical protein